MLYGALDMKLALSIAFHPQTDGQVERLNRTVEETLRAYVNHRQNDWDQLLTVAEFTINNAKQASTGYSPFELTYGQKPLSPSLLHNEHQIDTCAPQVDEFLECLRALHKTARKELERAQHRQKSYADSRHAVCDYAIGEKVYLSAADIDTDITQARPSQKLKDKWLGLFTVLEHIGSVAYRLKLPSRMRIHPVFHVSKLEPVPADPFQRDAPPPPPAPVVLEDEPQYEVEEILDHRKRKGRLQFLVKWLGYPLDDARWEPRAHLEPHAAELLREYEEWHLT
jgi:hypothetical protein